VSGKKKKRKEVIGKKEQRTTKGEIAHFALPRIDPK